MAQAPEITTALKVTPITNFHSRFQLDTLLYQDTARHYTAEVYFPYSPTNERFNTNMMIFIKEQIQLERPTDLQEHETTFSMWVLDYQVSGGVLVSFNFIYQSYTQGAAHYNHGYATFNYNTIKKRVIEFNDVFKFTVFNTRNDFCRIVNESQPHVVITEEELYGTRDFFLINNALCLCFDDYEKRPGMIVFVIDGNKIKKFASAYARKYYLIEF